MTRLAHSFARFREGLTPSEGLRQQIAERVKALTIFMQQRYPVTESFPIGSYARGTLVPPPRDVDLLFALGPTSLEVETPTLVLKALQNRLRESYPQARVQRHSVGLPFQDFAIDVVPALRAQRTGAIRIPELDDANDLTAPARWIETRPRDHARRVATANERSGGVAAALIATLKHINRSHATALKSFHLESAALDVIEGRVLPSDFAEALRVVLEELATRVKGPCVDVAGTQARLDTYLADGVRRDVANRFANHAGTLAEAIRLDSVELARKVVPALP